MRLLAALGVAVAFLRSAGPALAWGDLGHKVTALIAYQHLTPKTRTALEALLAADDDRLTPPDFASRATWADKYRNGHRETAAWHFVDIEIDHPDLEAACFGYPAANQPASAGPAQDCVVDKIEEFESELASKSTSSPERLLALKFLIHFVGDLHQPLHASDHQDRGGNCIGLSPSPDGRDTNLHAYWDTGVVETLGGSTSEIAARLDAQITPANLATWGRGDAKAWAMESFRLSRKDVTAAKTEAGISSRETGNAPRNRALVRITAKPSRVVAAQSSDDVGIGLIQVEISRELVGRRFAVEAGKALTLGVSEVTGGHTVRNFQLMRRGRSTPRNKANYFAKHMCETKSFCSNFLTAREVAA